LESRDPSPPGLMEERAMEKSYRERPSGKKAKRGGATDILRLVTSHQQRARIRRKEKNIETQTAGGHLTEGRHDRNLL